MRMFFRKRKNKLGLKINKFNKLNIGCGSDYIKDWLNVGIFPEKEISYGMIKEISGAAVLHFDMTNKLPMKDGSVKYIYASHFIEHLNFEEGVKLLERCYDLMRSGAVIRLTFPDLELWVRNYCENNTDFFEKYKNYFLKNKSPEVKTKGEIFMSQVHGWGHKWNWDFESMKHILGEIGFNNIEKKEAFDSDIPNIKGIEPRGEGRLLETIYVEAIK